MSGPVLTAWLEPRGGWTATFTAAGVGYLAFALWAAAFPLPPPPRAIEADARERAAFASPALLAFALIGFAYLGIETAATLFAVPYATDGLALEAGRGRSAISSFWLGILAGRAALVVWPGEADARWLVASGAAGAALVAASAALSVPWIEVVFALCGACVGAVFPLLLTLVAQAFPRAPALATALVAGGGELGGIAVPWLHGALGDRLGIRASVGALALWMLVLGVAGAYVARLSRRAGSPSRTPARR
jgi:fucose permease